MIFFFTLKHEHTYIGLHFSQEIPAIYLSFENADST